MSPDFCPPQKQDVFWQPLFVLECRCELKTGECTSQVHWAVWWGFLVTPEGRTEPKGIWGIAPEALLHGSFKCNCKNPRSMSHPGSLLVQTPFSILERFSVLPVAKFSSLANGSGPIFLTIDFCGSWTPLKGRPKAQRRIKIPLGVDVDWHT